MQYGYLMFEFFKVYKSNNLKLIYNLLRIALVHIANQISDIKKGKLYCPLCNEKNFTEESLWIHMPFYHIN